MKSNTCKGCMHRIPNTFNKAYCTYWGKTFRDDTVECSAYAKETKCRFYLICSGKFKESMKCNHGNDEECPRYNKFLSLIPLEDENNK